MAVVAGAIPAFAEGRQELSVTLTEAGTLNTFIKTDRYRRMMRPR